MGQVLTIGSAGSTSRFELGRGHRGTSVKESGHTSPADCGVLRLDLSWVDISIWRHTRLL